MLNKESKILITGAAGFIASRLVNSLNQLGYHQLYLMDDFTVESKKTNFENLICIDKIERNQVESFLRENQSLDAVIHLGARTDTTEMDYSIHEKLNLNFSKILWKYTSEHQVPLIYASSAATYGDGLLGYQDNHEIIQELHPLNPYGISKNEFDKWAIQESEKGDQPSRWYGLKFFNVYGLGESHKGRMASVIFHAYHQIKKTGTMKLFRSHRADFADGEQKRDFIDVADVLNVIEWLIKNPVTSGLYNLGTGKAETFLSLAEGVFESLNLKPQIQFVDTPEDIREKYQYFTEADMSKLRKAGYSFPFTDLKTGIKKYVQDGLEKNQRFD
ncbi:MAG: ADP-glyceromanno-heptose 6-epimerase [Chitinophagaceae bacterium]|nr:ADP-glyceromanno-heptose 6-epimerase [Chitinophagaceae bacterium]